MKLSRPYPGAVRSIALIATLLQAQPSVNFATDAGADPTTITVDENTYYQPIDGFGYCLTGGSALLINSLGSGQAALLNELFGTGSGPGMGNVQG